MIKRLILVFVAVAALVAGCGGAESPTLEIPGESPGLETEAPSPPST